MNYIIEDDFDFYSELKDLDSGSVDVSNNICMISHEPLTYNAVTLSCKHSFNYMPLYNELCIHNNKQYVSCPYCRRKADKLIPFIPLPNVAKIYGVNYPTKMCMPIRKCVFILNTGIYKGLPCEQGGVEYEHGIFCHKHTQHTIDNEWTAEKEKMFKEKTMFDLKKMLREKGLKVGGVKKDLIHRWFSNLLK